MIFLLEYERKAGRLRRLERFSDADRAKADAERLKLEQAAWDGDLEIVLVDAESLDRLRQTHSHYFRASDLPADSLGQPN